MQSMRTGTWVANLIITSDQATIPNTITIITGVAMAGYLKLAIKRLLKDVVVALNVLVRAPGAVVIEDHYL